MEYQSLIPRIYTKYNTPSQRRKQNGYLNIYPDGELIFYNNKIGQKQITHSIYDIKCINYIPFFKLGDWITIFTRDNKIHRFYGINSKKIYNYITKTFI